jgi:hypothetical protein
LSPVGDVASAVENASAAYSILQPRCMNILTKRNWRASVVAALHTRFEAARRLKVNMRTNVGEVGDE